jgi:hypothetical protein
MYTPGNILYFTPFYFPNGRKEKNKYFIVLAANQGNTLIATLPTSKDHIPSNVKKVHGCIDLPEINFNCYYFEANKSITESGWGFPFETYVYGPQVAEFIKENFESIYAVEEIDYEIVGKLNAIEFIAIKDCIKNSRTVKRKIRRALGAKI